MFIIWMCLFVVQLAIIYKYFENDEDWLRLLKICTFAHDVFQENVIICSVTVMLLGLHYCLWFSVRKLDRKKTLIISFYVMEAIYTSISWFWLSHFLLFIHM